MASSMTLGEKFKQLLKVNTEKDAQLGLLRKKLDQAIQSNRRELKSSHSTSGSKFVLDEAKSNPFAFGEEEKDGR